MQDKKMKKDKVVIVRLDAEQKNQAEQIATECGATVSELIRTPYWLQTIWPSELIC